VSDLLAHGSTCVLDPADHLRTGRKIVEIGRNVEGVVRANGRDAAYRSDSTRGTRTSARTNLHLSMHCVPENVQ